MWGCASGWEFSEPGGTERTIASAMEVGAGGCCRVVRAPEMIDGAAGTRGAVGGGMGDGGGWVGGWGAGCTGRLRSLPVPMNSPL